MAVSEHLLAKQMSQLDVPDTRQTEKLAPISYVRASSKSHFQGRSSGLLNI